MTAVQEHEGQRFGDFVRLGGAEAGGVEHSGSVARRVERSKNLDVGVTKQGWG